MVAPSFGCGGRERDLRCPGTPETSEPTIPYRNPLPTRRADLVLDGTVDLGAHDHLLAVVSDLALVLERITVDLSGVTFMDCSGIAALLAAHQLAVAAGSRLDVVAVSRSAWRMLTVAQVVRPFPRGALVLPRPWTGD